MLRYRLLNEQGDDLGPFRAATSQWAPGDRIPIEPGGSVVIVNVTLALDESDDVDGYLVVKPEE